MWFLNLVRWKNLLIIMLMQGLVFAYLCESQSGIVYPLLVLWLATLSITAAGNIINDIYDKNIDALNRPSGNAIAIRISTRNAWLLAALFNAIGIMAGSALEFRLGLINLAVALLLWLYSYRLKCLPLIGNIVVAVCMGLSVWVVNYAAGFCSTSLLFIFVMFAAVTGLVREMVKDLEDIEGDKKHGCRTMPVSAGIPFAKNLAAATLFFATALVASGCYYLAWEKPAWHLIYFSAAVIFPMLILFAGIVFAKTKKDYGRISTGLKIIMLTGLLYLPLSYYLSR